MKNSTNKLEEICNMYSGIRHNDVNYSIGGGLDDEKFASRRHEDARYDNGKLTLGEATRLFKNATGLESDAVKEILEYAVPNMEWHHAGKLPKAYGGGMKKTYFLNAAQIRDIAKNWDAYAEKLSLSKAAARKAAEEKMSLEAKKLEFLQTHAKRVVRTRIKPMYFYITEREMKGKYGWFDSSDKYYNLPEYLSGWEFDSEDKYQEFLSIK